MLAFTVFTDSRLGFFVEVPSARGRLWSGVFLLKCPLHVAGSDMGFFLMLVPRAAGPL